MGARPCRRSLPSPPPTFIPDFDFESIPKPSDDDTDVPVRATLKRFKVVEGEGGTKLLELGGREDEVEGWSWTWKNHRERYTYYMKRISLGERTNCNVKIYVDRKPVRAEVHFRNVPRVRRG